MASSNHTQLQWSRVSTSHDQNLAVLSAWWRETPFDLRHMLWHKMVALHDSEDQLIEGDVDQFFQHNIANFAKLGFQHVAAHVQCSEDVATDEDEDILAAKKLRLLARRLPTTVDGVVIVPTMSLTIVEDGQISDDVVCYGITISGPAGQEVAVLLRDGYGNEWSVEPENCYSSRSAATGSGGHEMTAPKRIQRKRTKGWRMPPNTVYVGRPTKWGNPFPHADRYINLDAFALWLANTVAGQKLAIAARRELRGKNLACWCPLGQPCHADELLRIANEGHDES